MALKYLIYKLLLDKGESLTLRKLGSRTYTAGTGISTPTNANYTVTAKIIEYSDDIKKENAKNPKGLSTEVMKKVLISGQGLSVVPTVNDLIIKSSVNYPITDVQSITEGSVVVAYVCQVKT